MSDNTKNIVFWATTIFGPASFVIGGVIGLMNGPEVVTSTQHLGYPAYFPQLLGFWKLAGALVVAAPGLPRLKEWAYAGFVFDLTAASISHAAVGDRAGDIIGPLVFLALVLASYALRPVSRRLVSPAASVSIDSAERELAA